MKKVWAYTIGRELDSKEIDQIKLAGQTFVNNWTAHENKLKADFEIFSNRIILVKVDEALYNASGCSIDKLLRFVKELEEKFNVELLNRMLIPYEKEDKLEIIPTSKLREKLSIKEITENTVVYITSISDENELSAWKKPLKETWLSKYLN